MTVSCTVSWHFVLWGSRQCLWYCVICLSTASCVVIHISPDNDESKIWSIFLMPPMQRSGTLARRDIWRQEERCVRKTKPPANSSDNAVSCLSCSRCDRAYYGKKGTWLQHLDKKTSSWRALPQSSRCHIDETLMKLNIWRTGSERRLSTNRLI